MRPQIYGSRLHCPCYSIPPNMPFVRLTWLLDPTTNLENLPRFQDLPFEALIYPEEMAEAYFVSHRWLERDHPDRTGAQIAVALSRTWAYEPWCPMARARRVGLWYDFMCLPQEPRSSGDEAKLTELLPNVVLLPAVCHPLVVLNGDTEFGSRAWCVAEAFAGLLNGCHWEIVSLSKQMIRYPALRGTSSPIRSFLDTRKLGYEAGLFKLRSWIQNAPGRACFADSELTLKEAKLWRQCIDVVHGVLKGLDGMMDPERPSELTSDQLLKLAAILGLETTERRDILFCLRAMERAFLARRR
jgi:hypothetical protein